jgi:hypothetical protein
MRVYRNHQRLVNFTSQKNKPPAGIQYLSTRETGLLTVVVIASRNPSDIHET